MRAAMMLPHEMLHPDLAAASEISIKIMSYTLYSSWPTCVSPHRDRHTVIISHCMSEMEARGSGLGFGFALHRRTSYPSIEQKVNTCILYLHRLLLLVPVTFRQGRALSTIRLGRSVASTCSAPTRLSWVRYVRSCRVAPQAMAPREPIRSPWLPRSALDWGSRLPQPRQDT